jgi:hypothetical protein
MPDNLREFIYLNDISVNSHLSSLGVGKPQEIVQESASESEKSGGGRFKIAEADIAQASSESQATTMSATAPYRFERLRSELVEEDIPIHENPDSRSVSRGDVVRISGTFRTMSLYRIEIALRAFLDIIGEETYEEVSNLNETELDAEVENMGQIVRAANSFANLAEKLIGEHAPLRIEYETIPDEGSEVDAREESAATLLTRKHLRVDGQDAFFDEKEYVIFARVDERVSSGETWDPVIANNVMSKYFGSESDIPDQRQQWKSTAREAGISMKDEDTLIDKRALVLHPIAVYW